eukprot:465691-Prymnesium_polylepis.1
MREPSRTTFRVFARSESGALRRVKSRTRLQWARSAGALQHFLSHARRNARLELHQRQMRRCRPHERQHFLTRMPDVPIRIGRALQLGQGLGNGSMVQRHELVQDVSHSHVR